MCACNKLHFTITVCNPCRIPCNPCRTPCKGSVTYVAVEGQRLHREAMHLLCCKGCRGCKAASRFSGTSLPVAVHSAFDTRSLGSLQLWDDRNLHDLVTCPTSPGAHKGSLECARMPLTLLRCDYL